jgi:hypothetical protein
MKQSSTMFLVRVPDLSKETGTKLRKASKVPKLMLTAFRTEGIETRDMMRTFVKHGKGQLLISKESEPPTPEEIQLALAQLKDIPRFLPFIVFVTVPVPGITESYVLLAVTLEKWLGEKYSLLPSSFRNIFDKLKDEEIPSDNTVEPEGPSGSSNQ